MATNETAASQIDNDHSSSNQHHDTVDIPLYTESKITRKQAIREIADVILHSNIKPRTVKYTLQLLQKLLPSDNTLPSTTDELFGAMISSENDWRLAQYFVKHKQSLSFLPSSFNMWNENSIISSTADSSLLIQESNISAQSSPLCLPFNSNESSSSSNDENELTPYERLQQCLRPITEVAENFNLNYATSVPLTINNCNSIPSSDSNTQSAFSSINPSTFLESFKRLISETSSTASTSEQDLFYTTRIFDDDDTDNETSGFPTSDDDDDNNNNKLCCFEMNGCDILNGGKRRRYD